MAFFGAKLTPSPSSTVEPYVPEDLSELTDRQIIEATYHKIAAAEHLGRQVLAAAAANPMLGTFMPKGL